MKVNAVTLKLTTAGDDGKKVVVNEASIRRDLRLDDAEGTACLPNAAIFEELARIGTMASAIICLANNQKFNFSKYILENLVKNFEAGVKFFMFPRFIQVFVNHQLGDMSHHKWIFVNPSLTKKIFANTKRVGAGFSGEITPLFATMMVQAPKEVGEIIIDAQDTPILTQPSFSQPLRKHKPMRKQRKETETNQAAKIEKLKRRVKNLKGKKKKRTHGMKRLYKGRMNEEDLFGVHDLSGDEVFVDVTTGENIEHDATVAEKQINNVDPVTTTGEVVTFAKNVKVVVTATIPQISKDELTLARTLMEIKAAKPKAKGVIIQEPYCKLAAKLQEGEKGELTIEDKSKLFVELMNKRKKHFDRLRSKERRRKPPTKTQKRKQMCTYLKNMARFTHNQLKSKSFEEVQQAFNKTMDWVNNFVAMDSELVKDRAVESFKRTGE
nr:hypothetical protein [Tanacetum cinerariifolium]